MTDTEGLGDRLIAEDGIAEREGMKWRREQMKQILENEKRFGRRVRIAALVAWGIAVTTLFESGLLLVLSQSNDSLLLPTVVLGVLGTLSLIVAVITTVAWLMRSRTPTLAAIDMRLAALEDLLRAGRD